MNRIRAAVLTFAVLSGTFISIPMVAQGQPTTASDTGTRTLNPDQVVDKLAAKLNLSEDQKNQIRPIIADRQQKLLALKSDDSRRRKKARKAKGIFEESDKKIEAILNDQQKQQYAQMKQEMREEFRARMQERKNASGS